MADDSGTTLVLFTAFSIVAELLILAYVIDRAMRGEAAERFSWVVYGMGVPAVLLGALFIIDGDEARWWIGPMAFAAWTLFGAVIDHGLRIRWRDPARWPVLAAYVALFAAAQVALWVPLWFVHPAVWATFGALLLVILVLGVRTNTRA